MFCVIDFKICRFIFHKVLFGICCALDSRRGQVIWLGPVFSRIINCLLFMAQDQLFFMHFDKMLKWGEEAKNGERPNMTLRCKIRVKWRNCVSRESRVASDSGVTSRLLPVVTNPFESIPTTWVAGCH